MQHKFAMTAYGLTAAIGAGAASAHQAPVARKKTAQSSHWHGLADVAVRSVEPAIRRRREIQGTLNGRFADGAAVQLTQLARNQGEAAVGMSLDEI
ncbi:hypothetical protein [uncultured Tateyamaria sp.]|uniref:hypothetical protein n=1 Tax=uncultured Tateyamaria sp. TaxID=455651 RepID=UPI0026128414|nr:hypothetical protein [uncultured Tateyamaria sp.]